MAVVADDPLVLQQQIVQSIIDCQTRGDVTDALLAEEVAVDRTTLAVHLEMLAVEDRIQIERLDDGYTIFVSPAQRAKHSPPPVAEPERQSVESLGDSLNEGETTAETIAWWLPILFGVAGLLFGFVFGTPEERMANGVFAGIVGLIVGTLISRNTVRAS